MVCFRLRHSGLLLVAALHVGCADSGDGDGGADDGAGTDAAETGDRGGTDDGGTGGSDGDGDGDDGDGGSTDDGGEPTCEADGIDLEATAWTLPDWPTGTWSWRSPGGGAECGEGWENGENPSYSLVDLTGDALADLVVTYACDQGEVGDARWMMYANDGAGFSTEGRAWTLPDWPTGTWSFRSLGGGAECGEGWENGENPSYALTDLTGDGLPDLVLTYACDEGGVGDTKWLIYENTGDGFSADAQGWTLPDWPTGTWSWRSLGGGAECGEGWENGENPSYAVLDLVDDERPDLVLTYACDDGGVGDERWLVYTGQDGGFAAEGKAFALPDWPTGTWSWRSLGAGAECGEGWENGENPSYATTDVTGDGRVDLVLTYACDQGGVGDERWMVYAHDGDGFATDGFAFALPDWPTGTWSWRSLGGGAECGEGWENGENPSYSTMDLDGNGALDLVVTYACDQAEIGDLRWMAYFGRCG